jgi:hypothetical protein
MSFLKTPLFLVVLTIFALGGCASKRPSASFTYPEIGTITTKGVGESLVMQGTGNLEPKLIISKDVSIGAFVLRKGRYEFDSENSTRFKFERDDQEVYLLKTDNTVCINKVIKENCGIVPFSLETGIARKSADSFQQTLLYNGKIGNRITLGYREFSNDMARAAFSNEVSYDLSESTILGYKGARVEIVKATNTEITYKILSGFH